MAKCCRMMRTMKKRMKREGGGDDYLDTFGAHFEPSSSWVGAGLMEAASGFVISLTACSTIRSCSPSIAHSARWPWIAMFSE